MLRTLQNCTYVRQDVTVRNRILLYVHTKSKRPGRIRAASNAWGRLVAASTMIPCKCNNGN